MGLSICFIQSRSLEKVIFVSQMLVIVSTLYCVLTDITLIKNVIIKNLLIILKILMINHMINCYVINR